MNRIRKQDESFKEYRANLRKENKVLKKKMGGKLIWNSESQGTYIKK